MTDHYIPSKDINSVIKTAVSEATRAIPEVEVAELEPLSVSIILSYKIGNTLYTQKLERTVGEPYNIPEINGITGWNTHPKGTGSDITSEDLVTDHDGYLFLYGMQSQYTLTPSTGGSAVSGHIVTLPEFTGTAPADKTFLGWVMSGGESSRAYDPKYRIPIMLPGDMLTLKCNVTVYPAYKDTSSNIDFIEFYIQDEIVEDDEPALSNYFLYKRYVLDPTSTSKLRLFTSYINPPENTPHYSNTTSYGYSGWYTEPNGGGQRVGGNGNSSTVTAADLYNNEPLKFYMKYTPNQTTPTTPTPPSTEPSTITIYSYPVGVTSYEYKTSSLSSNLSNVMRYTGYTIVAYWLKGKDIVLPSNAKVRDAWIASGYSNSISIYAIGDDYEIPVFFECPAKPNLNVLLPAPTYAPLQSKIQFKAPIQQTTSNYSFVYYSQYADGSGYRIYSGQSVTLYTLLGAGYSTPDSITLYAQYEGTVNTTNISLRGLVDGWPDYYQYITSYGEPLIPTSVDELFIGARKGYHISKYYDSSTFETANEIIVGETPNLASNNRSYLYAYPQWTPNEYTIEFNANNANATGSTSSMSMTYGTSENLTANGFSVSGYTFDSWNTVAGGTGTSYSDGELVDIGTRTDGETVTLYAQWTAVS